MNNLFDREHKIEVLKNQAITQDGYYYKYLKTLYDLFFNDAILNNRDYSEGITYKTKEKAILDVYDNAFVSPSVIGQYQKDLSKLGYISIEKHEKKYRYYILKELDF